MRTGHGVHRAFGVALLARGRANGVARFLDQQRLVAVQGVEAAQAALELAGELRRSDLHGGGA
ncbi:hypothetical protein FQZ97_1130740 [compost metagenome]